VGRIIKQDGEVIDEVKRVIDTQDGFLRIERFIRIRHFFVKNPNPDDIRVVTDIISKDQVRRIEDIRIISGYRLL